MFVFKIKKKRLMWNPPKLTMVSLKWRVYLYTNLKTSEEVNLNDKRQLNRINQSVQQIRLQFLGHFHTNLNGA